MIEVLSNKNYRLILLSKVISGFGDIISSTAIMLYTLNYTKSYTWTSLSLFISFLPNILFSSLSGILADKFNNKKIMISCDALNAIFAFILALIVYFKINILLFLIVAFFMNTLDVFFSISSSSLIQQVIDRDMLFKSNAFANTVMKFIGIISPVLATLLCKYLGYSAVFIINSISFIVSFFIEYFINYDSNKETNIKIAGLLKKDSLSELYNSYRILKNYKFIFYISITGGSILNFILAPLSLYMPVFIKSCLRIDDLYYGILVTAIPIGNIVYSTVAPKLKVKKNLMICIGLLLEGLSFLLLGISNTFFTSYISMIIFGLALGITGINLNTLVQEEIANNVYGKVSGLISTILNISVPLGYLFGGYILTKLSLNVILICSGIVIIFCSVYSFKFLKQKKIILE